MVEDYKIRALRDLFDAYDAALSSGRKARRERLAIVISVAENLWPDAYAALRSETKV